MFKLRGFTHWIIAICILVVIVGCNTKAKNASAPTIKTVNSGYLTVAIAGDMPMTALKDGKLIGADGDVLNIVAEKLNLKVKPELMAWPGPIQAVQSGRADIAIGDIWWSEERSKAMLMTDAIYYVGTMMLQKNETKDLTSIDAFKGMKLGTGAGSSNLKDLENLQKNGGLQAVVTYPGNNGIIEDIRNGRIDGALIDPPTGAYVVKEHPDFGLKLVAVVASDPNYPTLGTAGEAAWAVNKQEKELYDAINTQVTELWKSGKNREVLAMYGMDSDAWFTSGANLRAGIDRPSDWTPPASK